MSLHSHSSCSRESLAFLPDFARRIPVVADFVSRGSAAYARRHGRPLDFAEWHWRPPVTPAAVVASERDHLQRRLGLDALVSLTDHDSLEAPHLLRSTGHDGVPLSLEWTVPFDRSVFHLGVHAVDPRQVDQLAVALAAYTDADGRTPPAALADLLDWLCECPETIVVLNHPYWDMTRVGQQRHDSNLLSFLRAHRDRIHALELNGYRTWTENRRVLPLAEGFAIPLVGGGDRHGHAPNAIVNLTGATSLAEFARELRIDQKTCCVLFPEYADPFPARLLQTASHVLKAERRDRQAPIRWDDRVFRINDGIEEAVSTMWNGPPLWLDAAVAVTRMMAAPPVAAVLGLWRTDGCETLEADCAPELEAIHPLAPDSAAA
ncbi:MAG: PHP domain-containing protein [Vicinamibacterales bacterium]